MEAVVCCSILKVTLQSTALNVLSATELTQASPPPRAPGTHYLTSRSMTICAPCLFS